MSIENSPHFLFLGEPEPELSRNICFCMFKSSFVVSFILVKPEGAAMTKMWN